VAFAVHALASPHTASLRTASPAPSPPHRVLPRPLRPPHRVPPYSVPAPGPPHEGFVSVSSMRTACEQHAYSMRTVPPMLACLLVWVERSVPDVAPQACNPGDVMVI
jgi:hypothetical protein